MLNLFSIASQNYQESIARHFFMLHSNCSLLQKTKISEPFGDIYEIFRSGKFHQ